MTRTLRVVGWTLIAAGMVILLYLLYSLLFTNLTTKAAQADLSDQWPHPVASLEPAAEEGRGAPDDAVDEVPPPPDAGAVAVLEFSRPASDEPVVHADPLFVVSGVGRADLARGPGHYPDTAAPGQTGNFAVAGHRTTHGAPFFHLDDLREDDEVHVTDRAGDRHTYRVVDERIVAPTDVWVVGEEPRGASGPTLTLTTCHPRFSAAQRLVVFAELVE